MLPWLGGPFAGNPHAAHRAGRAAALAIERAADAVAALLGVRASEIVFTSGATEANHLALLGLAPEGYAVAVSAIEHPSVLTCRDRLAAQGRRCHVLPVDAAGRLDPAAFSAVLAAPPALVSVIAASNEIGTRQDIAAIVRAVHGAGGLVHSDATQILARAPFNAGALDLDAATMSGHKLYGPMGVGVLFVRSGLTLAPLLAGGGQQGGRRAGTVPVALAVGLGEACRILRAERDTEAQRLDVLARRFWAGLRTAFPAARLNGVPFDLPGVDAADLLPDVPDLMLATGAACASDTGKPSHVLTAIGLDATAARATLRVGLGRFTTAVEVDEAVRQLAAAVQARARSAVTL
jgi:cysteine desulfurase